VNGLVNLILKNTEKYIESARQVAGSFESPYRSVLVGHYSHRTNIKRRLQFLEYLISAGKVITLSKEDIGRLWNIFIVNPLTHRDSEMFFKWLQKAIASKNFISPALMHSIFEDFLCNAEEFPPEKIRQNGFTCFHKFFLQLNYNEKKLEIRGNLAQRNHPELIGESYLFTIMTVVEDNNVYIQVANLLVSLYLKLTKNLAERKVDLWNSFINTILEIISNSLSSPFIIYRCLNLLQSFLEETDTTTSKEESSSQTVFYVKQVNETENNRLHVPYYSNVGMLRKKIAEFYKKPKYSVVIHTGGVKYDSNDDELPLSNLRSSIVIAEFIASKNGEVSPKIIMSRHQALNDTLYQLLGDDNQPYISTACKLILSLPFNERLKTALKDLNEPIESLLESGSIYRLLYCLMIIDGLVKDEEWLERFTQVRGPQHLVKVFLDTDISASGFSARYSAMVVKILEILLTRVTVDVSPKKIVRKVLDSILQVCEAWTQPCELNQEEAAEIPKNADRLLMRFMELHTDQSRSAMSKYSKLDKLLTNGLILCHNSYLSTSMVNLLLKQCDKSKRLRHGILRMLLSLMDAAIEAGGTSEGYWVLTTHLLSEDDDNEDICIQTARKIVKLLYDREPEKSSKDQDKVMVGMLKILNVFLQKRLLDVSEELIELVLHKCLFEVPSEEKHSNLPPKCKSSDSRREAFQLLHKMCGSNRQALLNVLKYLCKFHEDPSWRTGKSSDWNYSPNALEKSETGYVGMKNLGCTCYMNSILQQLFMTPSFREGILRATLNKAETPEDNLLLQLQYIFSALKESDKQYINPKAFTQSFKDWEGKPINVLEQMDVDEFFNTFMDRLENLLKGHQNEHIIKNHFGGLQATELIGKGSCNHKSERDEPFLALPVQVKNKKSLIESLESFVEGELLEGDNAYQCDHCEAKVPAVRRVCIKHLPNILIIVLRRFEFNYDTMTRLKVNDYCEFPTEIDMEPFTQEGLERKELLKKKEKAMQEGVEFDKEIPGVLFPEDYYNYKLKGAVIHMGTADSGHYYSFIQDRAKEQWYEFNDTLVRPFDPEDFPSEAFGGEERWSSTAYSTGSTTYNTGSRSALVEKYRNAYLLFYERKGVYRPRNTDEDRISSMRLDDIEGEYTEFKQVKEENERYWRCRSSFSPEYIEFVLDLARSHDETEVLKFVCAFVMTTLLRSKDAQRFPGFITILKSKLKTSPEVSTWLLETVSVEPVLKELLLDCPINERRKIIVGLLCHAIFAVDFEGQKSFLGRVLNKLPLAKKPHSKNFAQYFELLYRVVKLYRTLLSENFIIFRLFSYLIESPDEYPPCPEDYIHSDIYLGYDHYTPTEESVSDRFTSSENSSIAYLLLTLEHGMEYLKPDQKLHLSSKTMISKLSVEGLNKISAKAVGRLFAKMSKDNSKVSGDCIMILTQGINDNDYDYHKIFMRELTWILKMEDSIQAERVEYAMRNLLKVMKENNKYYKATETCIDYIFRFALKFSIIKDWIAKKNSEFKWLDQWLRDNQYPPSTYTQTRSNVVMYKGKNSGWTSKSPVRSNADRLDFLRKLMKGQVQPRREEWDSDEDLPDECRDIGSKVDIV
jgi:ubiquitin carboxyl-terminal hydrolase 9/24